MKKNNLNNLIIFLKGAGLYDEAREVGELANSGLLYHGSNVGGLKTLKPMPSAVLDEEAAVFATPERWMAISHIGSWTDSDIEQGVINGKPYMLEKKEGAFDRAYNSDSPGSLYSVSSEGFSDDSRLMREERIRTSEVDVIDEEKINDPLFEMESLGVKLIRADKAPEFYKDNFLEDWIADLGSRLKAWRKWHNQRGGSVSAEELTDPAHLKVIDDIINDLNKWSLIFLGDNNFFKKSGVDMLDDKERGKALLKRLEEFPEIVDDPIINRLKEDLINILLNKYSAEPFY